MIRYVHGGSCYDDVCHSWICLRGRSQPVEQGNDLGFRVVKIN